MSYLSDGANDRIDVVVSSGVVDQIVKLMHSQELNIVVSSNWTSFIYATSIHGLNSELHFF